MKQNKSRSLPLPFFKTRTTLTMANRDEIIKKSKAEGKSGQVESEEPTDNKKRKIKEVVFEENKADDTEINTNNKSSEKNRYLRIVLVVVFGIIFLFSAYKVISILLEQKNSIDYNEELQSVITVSTEAPDEPETDESIPEEEDESVKQESKKVVYADGSKVNIDFDSLLKQNGDVKAWIYLEGTNVNYPIAQGRDNEQYLHTLLNGKTNPAGTMFIDYANKGDFSDIVTVIYGHNMHNGTMLHSLLKYKEQSFYNNHPYMYIYTPAQKYRLYVFGDCVTTEDSDVYYLPKTYDRLEAYLNIFRRNSMIRTNTTIEEGDKLVLISTCAYDIKDGRFVLLGKLEPFE